MNNTITNITQELSKKEKQSACTKAWREANKEKASSIDKAYREANREKIAAQQRAWRKANKEKQSAVNKARYEANKEKFKARAKTYHENNKEKINKKQRARHEDNKKDINQQQREWKKNNPEKTKQYSRQSRKKNKENILASNKKYCNKRMKMDLLFAVKTKLRSVVYYAFKRIKQNKPADTQTLLGCTWEEAKAHFESLFQEGMSWSNHGEWHIDHIRPVSSFGPDELKIMNHISNLQPLWAKDNLTKSGKWV